MHVGHQQAEPHFRRDCLAALALAAVAFAVFAGALDCGFVTFDDPYYVYQNHHVQAGLSSGSLGWALTTFENSNWHPLTWLSLQLDTTLWGAGPRGYHFTNVLLHAANAALLFLALRSLTGAFWRGAVVALLFAVHPLRAESVAWVTERKDVLSALFGFLALWAYAGYARRPSALRYGALVAAFVLSLMAKPMLVTLPFLLLVLDWWPLGRATTVAAWRWLGLEKLPLLALSAASAVVTYHAQAAGGAVSRLTTFSPSVRLGNAAISYLSYLGDTFWPAKLAVYYPHRSFPFAGGLAPSTVTAALLLLTALTAGAALLRRRAPYLLTGWLWYLGTLVPVIGLVQVGSQACADRYTYFPQVGILVALCWGIAELARNQARVATAAAAAAALLLAALTFEQVHTWKDSFALWSNAYRVSGRCPSVLVNLGEELEKRGEKQLAFEYYKDAVRLDPESSQIRLDLGNALQKQNRLDDAVREFSKACELAPDSPGGFTNRGLILFRQGKLEEAERDLETACKLAPDLGEVFFNLGLVKDARKDYAGAVAGYEEALRIKPNYPRARATLGADLVRLGDRDRGLGLLEEAVRSEPKSDEIHYRLGETLDGLGDLQGAATHFEQAARLNPNLAGAWSNLGIVRLRQGNVDEAVEYLARSVEHDPASIKALPKRLDANGRPDLVSRVEERLRQRELGRPAALPAVTP
jgi:protein O-mannosyl-transferase